MIMANESKLQDMIQTSLESLRSLVDSNTIIGDPINTPAGTTIIPISKISMGYVSGGLDYNGKAPTGKQNFGGGGGTGLSITPVGFLTVLSDGRVEMVNINAPAAPAGTIEQVADVIERSPAIIAKIKELFTKDSGKAEKSKAKEAPETPSETLEVDINE